MKTRSFLACSVTVAALLAPGGTLAQAVPASAEASSDVDAIIVTGSRIRRDTAGEANPVVVLDQASLAQTGLSSIADILQRLPGSAGGLNGKNNTSGNLGNPPDGGGVGAGSAEIDLRYLGAKRTLVLVDGLRWVNGSSASGIPASVDINSIPANMVQRIEVLNSGASPLYGSDAIAGVVNIITKATQEGLQASAQFGTFRQGDGHAQDYNLSYGIKTDRANIVFGGSYVKQDAVYSSDRTVSAFPTAYSNSCLAGGCSGTPPLGRFIVDDFNNPNFDPATQDRLDLTLKAPVNGKPQFDIANPTGPNSDFKNFTTLDRYNFAPLNYILTPSERYGAFVSAKYEIADNINFRVKAVYNRRNSQNQAAYLPLTIGPDAGNGNLLDTISIDATNPYNPFGRTLSSGIGDNGPQNYSQIRRRLVEAGQRIYTQHVDTLSLTATLDGSFHVGEHKWYWDVNAILGYNDAKQSFTGNVNAAKIQQALGPVSQCTGDCVPLNIFGGTGSITPAMLNFIGFTEHDSSKQQLNDYTANLSGDLFNLPAGPVGIAVGYEHRDQSASFTPDPVIAAGLGADIPAQPAHGQFSVNEVYGEARVPLLANTPFFHMLEVDGAIRYSNYSTFGGNTTLTGSALWQPIADLSLRGSYAQSVRAPSIGELFGSRSLFGQVTNDPCTNIPGSPFQTSATVRTNCIANGVPASGTYQEPNGGQINVVTGGNPNLEPERARTIILGGTYSPKWAKESGFASNLTLDANYYDIKLKGAISSIAADVLLSRCANTGDTLSCNAVQRTSSGFIREINGSLQNIGLIQTRGIDITLNYRSPKTSIGSFGLTWNNTFLLAYTESVPATTGFTVINRLGTEKGSPDQAYPKYKATGIIDWSLGSVFASFTGRFIKGVVESQNGNVFGNKFYGDVQIAWSPPIAQNRITLTAGVNNVFNTQPPGCLSCSFNGFDPTTYDVPGQFGYLRIAYKM